MTTLFGDDSAPVITRLTPDKSTPWVYIITGRHRAAKAPASQVSALGLAPGTPWTPTLASAVALAADTHRAKLKAVALLRVRARSSAEVASRLQRGGHTPAAIKQAITQLTSEKILDDASLAATRSDASLAKGLSDSALNQRLLAGGLPATTPKTNDHARALAQARNRAAKLPESLSAAAKHRRLLAALARLGYDEETAQEAVQQALGSL